MGSLARMIFFTLEQISLVKYKLKSDELNKK